jgi:hypothetical protein
MRLLEETVTPTFTPNQINDQIEEVGKAAKTLAEALLTAQGEAVSALNAAKADWQDQFGSPAPTLADCQRMALYLAGKASTAKIPQDAKSRAGKAPSLITQDIAHLAAVDFFEITGKEPTRSENRGEFPDFLELLFRALQIKSKASSSFAQRAVTDWAAAQTPA